MEPQLFPFVVFGCSKIFEQLDDCLPVEGGTVRCCCVVGLNGLECREGFGEELVWCFEGGEIEEMRGVVVGARDQQVLRE